MALVPSTETNGSLRGRLSVDINIMQTLPLLLPHQPHHPSQSSSVGSRHQTTTRPFTYIQYFLPPICTMLTKLPAELLLSILSFLDNLDPVSASNRSLSGSVRDYQASQLRTRLSRIRNVDLLMSIWSPPTFFTRSRGRRGSNFAPRPKELINVLCDPAMIPRVEAYLADLEQKAWTAERVAEHLLSLVSFSGFRSGEERIAFATKLVIYLWSSQQQYGHDLDGYFMTLREEYGFQDVCARDRYFAEMSPDIQGWLVAVYDALSQALRRPFVPSSRRGEGLGLYRRIVQDGMEDIRALLDQRGHC